MVDGIEKFKEYFTGHEGKYVIIGGAACDLVFDNVGVPFRGTRDIDMVLCVEVVDRAFGIAMKNFLEAGGYEARERSTGTKEFYRFHQPTNGDFPYMIELFSRKPDALVLPDSVHLSPITVEDSILSLSAILLDDEYYQALDHAKTILNGVSIIDQTILIPFKARAYLNLTESKEKGDAAVKSADISKHRLDVFRLAQLLTRSSTVQISDSIKNDLRTFIDHVDEMADSI